MWSGKPGGAGWPGVASPTCWGLTSTGGWLGWRGGPSSTEANPGWFTSGHRGGPGMRAQAPVCSAFQALACVTFAVILLAKAST